MPAQRFAGNKSGREEQVLVARDTADLLYRHGVGGTAVSVFTSTLLAVSVERQVPAPALLTWWVLITLSLFARVVSCWFGRKRMANSDWDGRTEIRRYSAWVVLSALIWAAFPILFFPLLNLMGRTAMATILAGMGAGATTIFSASGSLGIVYSGILVLPAALRFLLAGGRENTTLGILGILFFVVMSISARVCHHASMTAIRLSRRNQTPLSGMVRERQSAEDANADLQSTQVALREMNQSLESRIQARTTDLEHYARQLARLGGYRFAYRTPEPRHSGQAPGAHSR